MTDSLGSDTVQAAWRSSVAFEFARLRTALVDSGLRQTAGDTPNFGDLLGGAFPGGSPPAGGLPADMPDTALLGGAPATASLLGGVRAAAPASGSALRAAALTTRPETPVAGRPRATAGGQAPERVWQRSEAEYRSATEARTWGPSACSAATITALVRARGVPVRITDVINEMGPAIDVNLGLVSRPGFVRTAATFGLSLSDRALRYDELQGIATPTRPVAVDITNSQFPGGHWIIVTGADETGVDIVDSSGYNLTRMSRAEFSAAWSGRGMVP